LRGTANSFTRMPGLSNFQRDRLVQLADMLDISGTEGLTFAIRKYLQTGFIFQKLTAAKKHMDIMAGSIVEAMGTRTPLQTAGAKGSSEACGMFIVKHDQNMTIFTSWHAGIDVDGRWLQSHVSLGVGVQDSMGTPLLNTVKWVYGLAFFNFVAPHNQVPTNTTLPGYCCDPYHIATTI
jgi:hypothetical protein